MAKFDHVAKTKEKLMVRFQEIDGKTGVWATCSQAVKDYAEKTFKVGDVVDVQADTSGEVGLYVTRISKPGQGGGATSTKSTTETVPKCEDCGKELKDDKYKKCYTCNQKKSTISNAPICEDCGAELKDAKYKKCWACNKKNPTSKNKDRGSDVNSSIKRQAIGHMTSRTLIALQGQVDQNNITEVMEVLYKKYQELVG